jgi:glycerol uptake facilitator-like aquaporin
MSTTEQPLRKRVFAEALGTGLLVAAVVGSGIMAERLAGGNIALALLANTVATGTVLAALILTFGSISGAHFNPAVSLAFGFRKLMPWREVAPYVAAQFVGAVLGTVLAHVMFGKEMYSLSHHERSGIGQFVSGHFWIAVRDLGLPDGQVSDGSSSWRGQLHHRGLLVYGFDFICKSGYHCCTLHHR